MGDSEQSTWLRFGAVVTGTGDVLPDTAVHVVDGTIVEIRPGHEAPTPDIDRPHQTLIPGFVDAHVHLVFGYEPTHDEVRNAAELPDLDTLAARAATHAAECVRGGVTTARDCGDRAFVTVALRDAIVAGRLPGPRLLVAGPPITSEGGHLHWCGGAVASSAELPAVLQRHIEQRVDLVKLMASGGSMTTESDPSRPQFELSEVSTVTAHAHAAGLPVAAHAHSVSSIGISTFGGVDSIEHCSWRDAAGRAALDDAVTDEIIKRDIAVVLTMAGIQRALLAGAEPTAHEFEAALSSSETGSLAGDFAWARVMRSRGARVAVASDAGVRLTPFAGFADTVRCGIEALGITAAQGVELATRVPASVLRVADLVGTIEAGKVADLVALDGLITESSRELPALATVWQDGRLVSGDSNPG